MPYYASEINAKKLLVLRRLSFFKILLVSSKPVLLFQCNRSMLSVG